MKTLVAFQIGRGGRFNNGGFLSVESFNKTINNYLENDCFEKEGFWCNQNGESLELAVDNDGVGRVEFDGEYNTIYVKEFKDCDNSEISTIWDDSFGYDFYLKQLDIQDFAILRAFNLKSSDVFWSDDLTNTIDAEGNGIEEISEEVYYEEENGYDYQEVNNKYYRKEI